jgi:hypothetical protein
MARPKRSAYFTPTISRTLERIIIAGFAALAARGSGESIAISAITIFVIVACVEELGRGFVWRGKRVTLRELAQRRFARGGFRGAASVAGRKRRRRRAAPRKVGDSAVDPVLDAARRQVQE